VDYATVQTQNQTKTYKGLGFPTMGELRVTRRFTMWRTDSFVNESQNPSRVFDCVKNPGKHSIIIILLDMEHSVVIIETGLGNLHSEPFNAIFT